MVVPGTPWSDEERERLAMLLERGHSRRECAEALGRTFGSVANEICARNMRSRVSGGDPMAFARSRPVVAEPDVRDTEPKVPVRASVAPPRDEVRPNDPAHDPALHVPTAPRGYHLRGVSTLLDGAGTPVQTWVKTTRDP